MRISLCYLSEGKNYFRFARELEVEVLVFLESCKTNSKIIYLKETFLDLFLFLRKIRAGNFFIFNKKLTLERDHLLNQYIFPKKRKFGKLSVILFEF